MSSEEAILRELQAQAEAISVMVGDESFSTGLVRMQTEDRMEWLETKLADIRNPSLDFILGGDVVRENAVPADLLGVLVGRFQRTITWTANALRYGPGVEKEPSIAISRGTAVDVLALAPGSFRILMRRPKPEDDRQEQIADADRGLFESSVETILGFVEDAERGDFSDDVERRARAIGPRPAGVLRLFVKKLGDSGAEAQFKWRSRDVSLSPSKAKALSDWLGSVEYERRVQGVTGPLVAADAERGTFAIRDAGGELFSGKAAADVVSHAEIQAVYRARLQVVTSIAEHTGSVVDRYELLGLSEP